jgi:uncharacterized protein YndB with AHSA1/START domain
MPSFTHSTTSRAAPEEVWKLLYDPTRFTEWWEGMHTVEVRDGAFVFVQDDVPDLMLPHDLDVRQHDGVVVIACQRHDLHFEWALARGPGSAGTRITVHVTAPDDKVAVLGRQEGAIRASLARLAELADR